MKLVTDLGIKEFTTNGGNTYRKRVGIYKCPICKKDFEALSCNVNSGKTPWCKSCGTSLKKTTHGKSKGIYYSRWVNMKGRCYNKKNPQYADWGGRGIKVCKEWLEDFEAYNVYISSLPNAFVKDYSVDRIDNDEDYKPGNLRWATRVEQSTNRRMFKSNTSGVTGVYWTKSMGKWLARISVNNKKINLGYYVDKVDAINARKLAEIKYKVW